MAETSTNWKRIEVGLVLQGGGALGAYEWGAVEALFGLMDELEAQGVPVELKAVTGVSIGAINGACIVGAKDRADGVRRLAALWNGLKFETPFGGRVDFPFPGMHSLAPARDLSLFGVPGFYAPWVNIWDFARWTSLYDTKPLEKTLSKHVCFEQIAASSTTFVVTAVDVMEGKLKRFRNKAVAPRDEAKKPIKRRAEEDNDVVTFTPSHIIASGSLAPQFPWTEIGGQYYWDGGIVDNTPLGDAMEAFSAGDDVYRLLVVMNLFPLAIKVKPGNLFAVTDRVQELSYGNRVRQDQASAQRINGLVRVIEQLHDAVKEAGGQIDSTLQAMVDGARGFKIAKTVEIDLQNAEGPEARSDDADGARDFSAETVDLRHRVGKARAEATLRPILANHDFLQPARFAAAPAES